MKDCSDIGAFVPEARNCGESLNDLFGVVYISTACADTGKAETELIVSESRVRNRSDSITGFLARAGPNFIQYLEGERSAVTACVRRICRDERHFDLRILAIGSLGGRHFAGWSMGYFAGDVGGSERLEAVFKSWSGTDRSLFEEVWRIARVAQSQGVHAGRLSIDNVEPLIRWQPS